MQKIIPLLSLILCACTTNSPEPIAQNIESTPGLCGEKLPQAAGLKMTMANQAFHNGQYFSSLATLQQIDENLITKSALQASAHRKAGQWEQAKILYQDLLSSCIKGNAAHGLGLIAAYQGKFLLARDWLEIAVRAEPANANIRNDYGFLLLSLGDEANARTQLVTALELNPRDQIAAKNLWLVLTRGKEDNAAQSLQQRFAWTNEEHNKLTLAAVSLHPLSNSEPK